MKISPRQQRSVLSTYYFRNLSGLVKSGWGNKVGGCSTARAPHYLNFRPFWARARRATRQWVSPAAAAAPAAAGEGRPSQPQTSSPPYSAAGNRARDRKKGFLFEEVGVVQYLGKAVCNGVQRRRCRQCSAIVFSMWCIPGTRPTDVTVSWWVSLLQVTLQFFYCSCCLVHSAMFCYSEQSTLDVFSRIFHHITSKFEVSVCLSACDVLYPLSIPLSGESFVMIFCVAIGKDMYPPRLY